MEGKLKKILLILFLVTLVKSQSEIKTRWLNLPLDHFNIAERRTFDLRYLMNENVYRENGPILIFVNDGTASTNFITEGNMFEVAEREGGVLISLEQRYFGRSFPTSDASFENLQWLTIHQCLADIAIFSNFMKQQYSDAPVILWGRGKGGTLATWARQKYPNVIDGAWGSSALLNIVADLDYLPNVFRTITQIGGNECGQVITDAFRMIEESFESGNTSYIEQRLMTCESFDVGNSFDLAMFTYLTAINVGSFVSSSKFTDIEAKCRIMRGLNTPGNPPLDPLDAFARWYIDDYHLGLGTSCNSVNNEENIKLYQDPSWNGNSTISSRRQRFWLTCTQFAQWRVGNYGEGHPFGTRINTKFIQQWCAGAFENELLLDSYWAIDTFRNLNKMFGGLYPSASRLFLTQGEMDASRSLGPSSDINSLSPVVVIPLQSFGRDLHAPDAFRDSFVLYQTKLRIQQTIHDWINYARFGDNSTLPTN